MASKYDSGGGSEPNKPTVPFPGVGMSVRVRRLRPERPAKMERSLFSEGTVEPKDIVANTQVEHIDMRFDVQDRVLWCQFRFNVRPCFTEHMLADFVTVRRMLHRMFSVSPDEDPVRVLALSSPVPGVWNLGGDLDLFSTLIRTRNRERLLEYAIAAAESGYHFTNSFGLPLLTISLVQGDALGGGFEAALSGNVLIAERNAKFGFPEILFNLFPGMGAYTFLARRLSPGLAERMILSGNIFTAEQLYDMGVVDILAEDGGAVEALYDMMGPSGARLAAGKAVTDARRIVHPVRIEELHEIARNWTDLALTLTDSDLRRMARLVSAQDKRAPNPHE
jgi:DSF synthase